jgi:hypothetical protein
VEHFTAAALEAGLDHIRRSPRDAGTLELIVCRPAVEAREVLEEGELDLVDGLVGDTWRVRGSSHTGDGSSHRGRQLTVMNARVIALLAHHPDHYALAGDQLYVDLDLSQDNLPPDTRLRLGSAVIKVTDQPHRGCAKFSQRFGVEALRFVNSEVGTQLRLRGLNAQIVEPGMIRRGGEIRKI